ncbi:MAG TPA: CapA family protein [Mobilitalea sp.]|nr:CapA family protein [Mobilitalea sp.]
MDSGGKNEGNQFSDFSDNSEYTKRSEDPTDESSPEENPASSETDPTPSYDETDNDPEENNKEADDKAGPSDETNSGDSLTGPIVLAFAGDVNLDENSKPVARYDKENKGILGAFSQDLVDEMNNADIFMLNNEFAYSTRGARIKEKSYTFRAHPKRVDILKEMGVDIVSLANNHALDYGVDALLDTFTTLEEAGIDYVGAGRNMERAKAPVYYTIGDTTIGFVAASRVIYAMDWYATDDRPGMIGTYDPELFVASIKEAKENSDYVVAFVHWGIERIHEPVKYQKNLAKIYIDAGADFVIGCHPHVMQGIEFYNGKPIAYSLGNYWFNSSKRESGLLKIYINPDGTFDVQLLPVMNNNTYTYLITDEKEKEAYYRFMTDISFNVEYNKDGFVTEKQ